MIKKIALSAAAGAAVMILWAVVANAVLGLRPRIDMRRPTNMEQVYQVLLANVATPGGYIVQSAANDTAPTGDPVFGIRYSGIGHASAGQTLIFQLLIALLTCALVAVLLSMVSPRVGSSYPRRVIFVALVGIAFAVNGDLSKYDIGGYPMGSALLLAANTSVAWILVGLAAAAILRPPETSHGVRPGK
jgi:hypothetical protein